MVPGNGPLLGTRSCPLFTAIYRAARYIVFNNTTLSSPLTAIVMLAKIISSFSIYSIVLNGFLGLN